MDTENRLTAAREEWVEGWVRKGEGMKQRKKESLLDTDNRMVITRGQGNGGRWKRVKGG